MLRLTFINFFFFFFSGGYLYCIPQVSLLSRPFLFGKGVDFLSDFYPLSHAILQLPSGKPPALQESLWYLAQFSVAFVSTHWGWWRRELVKPPPPPQQLPESVVSPSSPYWTFRNPLKVWLKPPYCLLREPYFNFVLCSQEAFITVCPSRFFLCFYVKLIDYPVTLDF